MPQWEVVGGGDKGGIMVRQGQSLKSEQCEERLSTGALVEELELVGERLHYKIVTGTGPETGWVSLKVAGKDLLEKKMALVDSSTWPAILKAALTAAPSATGNWKDAGPTVKPVGKKPERARARLLLFNWTGNRAGAGSAHSFMKWPKMLGDVCPPETWEVCEVAYPGRGSRVKDPNAKSAKEIVDAVLASVKSCGSDLPTVCFGFSFGAILAYETAVALARAGGQVLGLVVASAEPPDWPGRTKGVGPGGGATKDVATEAFEKILHEKGGTEMILQNPDMKRMFVPVIHSDMVMEEAYGAAPPSHPPLPCPVVAWRGAECPQIDRATAESWLAVSGCKDPPSRLEQVATGLTPQPGQPWLSDWYLCQGEPSAQAIVSAIAKDFGGAS